jgi:hypothetical protein
MRRGGALLAGLSRGDLSGPFTVPGMLIRHLPQPSSTSRPWVPRSTENEVPIGGIKGENLSGDVQLTTADDEDIAQ